MSRYESDSAFGVALETRLAVQSRETRVDLNRLRRRVVFERILTRLEQSDPGRWVLKGGMALEVRWRDRARATRDLDLAARDDLTDAQELRLALATPLGTDADGDRFRFVVGAARTLRTDEAGRPGWRFNVEATLAGRNFASVTVDVVVRPDEVTRTERVRLQGLLAFDGIDPADVEVIDRVQHFAEKLHALTRTYTWGPSSRVKDLADLVLLIDDGLESSNELSEVVGQVFASRSTHPVPAELPDPPTDWAPRYAELAADLDISARAVDQAMRVLRAFWSDVRSHKE